MTRKLNSRQLKTLIKEELRKLKEDTIAQIDDMPRTCDCHDGSTWTFQSDSGLQGWDCANLCSYVMMGTELPDGVRASKLDKGDFAGNAGNTVANKRNKRTAFKDMTSLMPIKHVGKQMKPRR